MIQRHSEDLAFREGGVRGMDEIDGESEWLERVRQGDREALGARLELYRPRLERVVAFRMDARLRGRIDSADVVQEAFLDATNRLDDYLADPPMPFFLWVRFLTVQKLSELYRRHLGTKSRDAGREISLNGGMASQTTSAVLAAQLIGRQSTPSQAAIRAETRLHLEEALNSMEPIDCEVLALRHFEQLDNRETARVLGISESAASNRYVRAIRRLKQIMDRSQLTL
jgi:RNA polymerase sigma-70 factor, ECF subfamily